MGSELDRQLGYQLEHVSAILLHHALLQENARSGKLRVMATNVALKIFFANIHDVFVTVVLLWGVFSGEKISWENCGFKGMKDHYNWSHHRCCWHNHNTRGAPVPAYSVCTVFLLSLPRFPLTTRITMLQGPLLVSWSYLNHALLHNAIGTWICSQVQPWRPFGEVYDNFLFFTDSQSILPIFDFDLSPPC